MRKYRTRCDSEIYHITTRGVGQQLIFEDDEDRRTFGRFLRNQLERVGGELYAWCFMDNHVHLLVHLELDALSNAMGALLTCYARYFNGRHGRSGHLFENRFDSVPIESTEQLLAAVRYIHQNPFDGPSADLSSYRWSSYREYLGSPFITATSFVLDIFENSDDFAEFHRQAGSSYDEIVEHTLMKGADGLLAIARRATGLDSPLQIARLDREQRDAALASLKNAGLSISQIVRLTGLGRNIIQRAK